ncbi:META domain-containing protein [Deinococcus petrolearius]|uniref:META domain-containing protein n=1 Tax=Deinococcus petrolearius TaxID=1751295 RepID=A0ABW1DMX6_9DEIO
MSLLAALTLLAVAGGPTPDPSAPASARTALLTVPGWTLRTLVPDGVTRLGLAPDGPAAPTLRLRPGGRVSGHTGCNLLSGAATLEGSQLRVRNLGVTRRVCPGAAGTVETAYLRVLSQVVRYRVQGQTLTLYARGAQRLVFQADGAASAASQLPAAQLPDAQSPAGQTPADQSPAAQTPPPLRPAQLAGEWQVRAVTLGIRAVPVPAGAALTLTGEGTGLRLSGRAGGCNAMNGQAELRGDVLHFSGVATTRMLCPDMTAENALYRLLGTPLRAEVQAGPGSDTLTWTGDLGRVILKRP